MTIYLEEELSKRGVYSLNRLKRFSCKLLSHIFVANLSNHDQRLEPYRWEKTQNYINTFIHCVKTLFGLMEPRNEYVNKNLKMFNDHSFSMPSLYDDTPLDLGEKVLVIRCDIMCSGLRG